VRVDPALRDEEFIELSMKRLIHKAKNHREAQKWDIVQQITMSPEERQRIANELKRRFYGSKNLDRVRRSLTTRRS